MWRALCKVPTIKFLLLGNHTVFLPCMASQQKSQFYINTLKLLF